MQVIVDEIQCVLAAKLLPYAVMITSITEWLLHIAETVPLIWFAILGPFLEEAIAIIPSPLIMTSVGSIAATRGASWLVLFFFVTVGTTAKTVASLLWWYAARFLSKETVAHWGNYMGISPSEMDRFEYYLRESRYDDLILVVTRSIPLFPTGAISIASGMLRIDFWTFTWTTFAGLFVTHSFYAIVGYTGSKRLDDILLLIEQYSTVGVILFAVIIGILSVLLWQRFFKDE